MEKKHLLFGLILLLTCIGLFFILSSSKEQNSYSFFDIIETGNVSLCDKFTDDPNNLTGRCYNQIARKQSNPELCRPVFDRGNQCHEGINGVTFCDFYEQYGGSEESLGRCVAEASNYSQEACKKLNRSIDRENCFYGMYIHWNNGSESNGELPCWMPIIGLSRVMRSEEGAYVGILSTEGVLCILDAKTLVNVSEMTDIDVRSAGTADYFIFDEGNVSFYSQEDKAEMNLLFFDLSDDNSTAVGIGNNNSQQRMLIVASTLTSEKQTIVLGANDPFNDAGFVFLDISPQNKYVMLTSLTSEDCRYLPCNAYLEIIDLETGRIVFGTSHPTTEYVSAGWITNDTIIYSFNKDIITKNDIYRVNISMTPS